MSTAATMKSTTLRGDVTRAVVSRWDGAITARWSTARAEPRSGRSHLALVDAPAAAAV